MCENHDYCYFQMPNEENKILEYKENQKSKKAPSVIYSDLECLLEKINNENKQTTIVNNHAPSGYSIYSQCSFDDNKNKLDYYRGEDCIEKFTDQLKNHATNILNCEQKNPIKLSKKEYESHKNQSACYICNKKFTTYDEDKNYYKPKSYCKFTSKYQGTCHKICKKHTTYYYKSACNKFQSVW